MTFEVCGYICMCVCVLVVDCTDFVLSLKMVVWTMRKLKEVEFSFTMVLIGFTSSTFTHVIGTKKKRNEGYRSSSRLR